MIDPERPLHTARLVVEPLKPEHANALFHNLQDKRLYRYYAGSPPGSIEELERRYAGWAKRLSPDGSQTWLNYALRRADGVYVGWIQATIAGEVATIGYDIFPGYWRQGYATEACAGLVSMLRASSEIRCIAAVVDVENVASIRLLERLGFARAWTGPSEDLPGRQDHRYEMPCARQSAETSEDAG